MLKTIEGITCKSRLKLLLGFFRCRRDQWKHKCPQAKAGVLLDCSGQGRDGRSSFQEECHSKRDFIPHLTVHRPTKMKDDRVWSRSANWKPASFVRGIAPPRKDPDRRPTGRGASLEGKSARKFR